jgi:subtilisin family serine protease
VQINGQMQQVKSAAFMGSSRLDHADAKALVDCGLGKPEDVQGKDLTGKIALIARGDIHFSDKVKAALSVHADGVLMYNNADGLISGTATEDGSELSIPVVMVEQSVGQQLVAALKAGQTPTASVAVVGTDYATFDGTSMATPHVSGVIALMKATHPGLTPQQVRDILKATSTALGPNDENQYGNGLVDAAKAVQAASQVK